MVGNRAGKVRFTTETDDGPRCLGPGGAGETMRQPRSGGAQLKGV